MLLQKDEYVYSVRCMRGGGAGQGWESHVKIKCDISCTDLEAVSEKKRFVNLV